MYCDIGFSGAKSELVVTLQNALVNTASTRPSKCKSNAQSAPAPIELVPLYHALGSAGELFRVCESDIVATKTNLKKLNKNGSCWFLVLGARFLLFGELCRYRMFDFSYSVFRVRLLLIVLKLFFGFVFCLHYCVLLL